jgi:hypothetical protein
MARRYIGTATIHITYNDNNTYTGRVVAGGKTWKFCIPPPATGLYGNVAYDSTDAYDWIARTAVRFGSTSDRGEPAEATADAIREATECAITDTGTYSLSRTPPK